MQNAPRPLPGDPVWPSPAHQQSDSIGTTERAISRMIDASLHAGKLRTQPDDESLLAKTQTLRKNNETLNSFISWSGLNYRQIREWRLDKLHAWCEQAERNNREDVQEPRSSSYIPQSEGPR
jgi:hypothetical protein